MTLTAPNCPLVDVLLADVENAVNALDEVEKIFNEERKEFEGYLIIDK